MPPDSTAAAQDSAAPRARSGERAGEAIPKSAFRHEMLLYEHGDEGFLDGTLGLVRNALAREAGVLVAVGAGRTAALVEALDADAQRVRFVRMRSLGRNPARIIPVWREFVREHALGGEGDALGIGEPVWPGRGAAELDECERHEALVNVAFSGGPHWRMLCAYDLDALERGAIESAQRTHPLLSREGTSATNDRYADAADPTCVFEGALPEPCAPVQQLPFALADLGAVRRAVGAWAAAQALAAAQTEELVLAVDELAVNSVRHGGGAGTLRWWREGARLLCEVRDAGRIEQPLVGRLRPAAGATGGRGLWLANQLCDLVQIRSSAQGTAVRLHKLLG